MQSPDSIVGRTTARVRFVALAAMVIVSMPTVATAQESREATITQAQAEKATRLVPYTPNKAEQILTQLQDLLVMLPGGFYPTFGSVYSGGGFTLGAGYRRYIGDRLNWNITGLYSAKNYKLIDLSLHSPRPRTSRFDFIINTGWRDATQVAFHGLGIDSQEDRTTFRMQQGYIGGNATVRPMPWAVFNGIVTYEAFTLADGTSSDPSVDDVFTPVTAPGLGASPDYLHLVGSAAIDTRPALDYARRGGLYEIAYHQYNDRDDTYTFDRLDAEVVQHLPIVREHWVFSMRARMQTTLGDTDAVPYFLLPALGSGSTLRGYSSWRFRDRHSLLLSGEWRWTPSRMAMDAAIFYDTGTVSDRRDGLSLGNRRSNVGFGVRFHSPVRTPLRIEIAKGSEGLKLVFAASSAF